MTKLIGRRMVVGLAVATLAGLVGGGSVLAGTGGSPNDAARQCGIGRERAQANVDNPELHGATEFLDEPFVCNDKGEIIAGKHRQNP
jgi:hypothetical protein